MADDTVTISVAEYHELLAFKLASKVSQGIAPLPSRRPVENDVEVALFLAGRFGKIPMTRLLEECNERFGWKRTLSKSAAYRYWLKLRKQTLN